MNRISEPLVSVVIPCYKHEKFLERSLGSVAAQTYPHLEVVITDDCSPDGSVAAIQQIIGSANWQRRFPGRTRFFPFKQNKGAHNSINFGIQQATGQIVTILNSDDAYHPERVERIVAAMTREQKEFAFTGVRYLDAEDQDVTRINPRAKRYAQEQTNIARFPSVGFACLTFNMSISTGNFAFTKSLYERVGEFKHYLHCHDWDFLLRCLVHTEPCFIPEPLYDYRFHGTNSFESLHQEGVNESAELLRNYFSLVHIGWSTNPIAPSALNWPSFYELFIQWYRLQQFQPFAQQSVQPAA